MAALTWREVSAPQFGGAASTFRTGAELQQNALSGLGEALKQFTTDRAATVDGQVLANALRVNDPMQYQQKLNDGSFLAGVDPSQVSTKTLGALGDRQRELLAAAAARQNIDQNTYTNTRTQNLDTIQDSARGATADRLGIVDPRLRALSPQQQLAAAAGEVNLEGGILNNANRGFQNRVQVRDDADEQAGIAAGINALRNSASASDALGNIESTPGLTPVARARAIKDLNAAFGNIYAPSAAPASGAKGGPAAPGTRGGGAYDTTFNFTETAQPVTSTPIRDVIGLQDELKSSQGHSPVGAFQINQATLKDYGPKVLGDNWQDQPLSPENQEKLGKAIFEDRKGGDLSKTWASLPNNSPGAYKNFTWDEMRSIISQGEVGENLPDDAATLRSLAQESKAETQRRVSQNNATGVTADIEKNLTDTRDAPTIVQDLIKTRFPNANQDVLLGAITKGQRDNPGLSAADVASAIARSATPTSTFNPLSRNFSGTTNFGGDVGVNDEVLQSNLDSFRTGKADKLSAANQRTMKQAQVTDNAQLALDQAVQDLQALSARKRLQPGINTEAAERKVDKATQQLQRALNKQQSDPSFRPVRQ